MQRTTFKLNRKASIPLVALLSLILGISIMIVLGLKVSELFSGNDDSDKSHYLQDFDIMFSKLKEGEDASRSLRLGPKDLFLFFDTGVGPIVLESSDEDSKNFIFNRSEKCKGKACICYCQGNTYWESIKDNPGLKLSALRPEEEFTCSREMICNYYEDVHVFSNSRGTQKYEEKVINKLNLDEDRFIYTPITLDIPVILQYDLEEENVFFEDFKKVKEKYSSLDKLLNPLIFAIDAYNTYDAKHTIYTSYFQFAYLEKLLVDYSWKRGYVLGGYGAAESKDDREDHVLRMPPVTLRIEDKGDGVYGVCIHGECLFDDEIETIKKDLNKKEKAAKLYDEFNLLRNSVTEVTNCVNRAGDDDAVGGCIKNFNFNPFFSVEILELLKPKLIFEFDKVTTIALEVDADVSFEPLEVALAFSCDGGETHQEKITLINTWNSYYKYIQEGNEDCQLSLVELPKEETKSATN